MFSDYKTTYVYSDDGIDVSEPLLLMMYQHPLTGGHGKSIEGSFGRKEDTARVGPHTGA